MFCVQNKPKRYWLGTGKRERKRLKDGIVALEKLKKSVSMICAKLVIETQLIIRKFLVGSL